MVTPNMPHALAAGEMIEEFRIIRVLGEGGFGIVYECENAHLPETVAIKEFLPPELAYRRADGRVMPLSDQTEETFNWARDRFLQEAKTLWELARPERHPNIVRVTRYREANGTAYTFMDFEQGRPLSELLEQQGRLPPAELNALFYPVLDGLERIHGAAILHRDIKPANILIRADGTPVLIDFGAARRVIAGQQHSIVSSYTPVYAALEQYHNVGDQGPWTDIYSFGAVLYQAVTGRKPLSAMERLCGSDQGAVTEECKGIYPQPILAAIDRALAIKPEERPRSVSEWRQYSATAADTSRTDEATIVSTTCDPAVPPGVSPPEDTALTPAISQVTKEPVLRESGRRSARAWLAAGMAVAPRIIAPARSALGNARVRLAAGMVVVVFVLSALGLYFIGGKPDPDPGTQDPNSGTTDRSMTQRPSETAGGTQLTRQPTKTAGDTPPPDKPVLTTQVSTHTWNALFGSHEQRRLRPHHGLAACRGVSDGLSAGGGGAQSG